jgi:hypothetical protein
MPPSNNETAAAKSPRSDWITPTSIAARTNPPPATAIREARMNLRQLSILAASSSMCSSMRTIASCGHHFLGLVDRPQPRRSYDAAGVSVSGPNDPCSYPIKECMPSDPIVFRS